MSGNDIWDERWCGGSEKENCCGMGVLSGDVVGRNYGFYGKRYLENLEF